jgi:hypothetical protein
MEKMKKVAFSFGQRLVSKGLKADKEKRAEFAVAKGLMSICDIT